MGDNNIICLTDMLIELKEVINWKAKCLFHNLQCKLFLKILHIRLLPLFPSLCSKNEENTFLIFYNLSRIVGFAISSLYAVICFLSSSHDISLWFSILMHQLNKLSVLLSMYLLSTSFICQVTIKCWSSSSVVTSTSVAIVRSFRSRTYLLRYTINKAPNIS